MSLAGFLRRLAALSVALTMLASPTLPGMADSFAELLSVPTAHAAAGIYKPISYQGKVTLTSGTAPANGQYNFRFKVFTGATLGSPVWTETWNGSNKVSMTGGLFSVQLGSLTSMTGSVNFNTDNLYLQVEFDPANAGTYGEVFAPRRRFSAVPYALNSNLLNGLSATQFLRSDTGSSITAGALHILSAGTSLTVSGTASGNVLHAERLLTTSGALVVQGTARFKGLLTIGGVTYTFPSSDGSASGKVLKTNGAGVLSWSTDTTGTTNTFGTGNVLTVADQRYVKKQGDTMTGALVLVNGGHSAVSAQANVLLEITGTASGATLHAENALTSSGTLYVTGNAKIGSTLTIGGVTYTFPTSDGSASGKVLKTNGAGVLSWSTDNTVAGSFGTGNVITISNNRYVGKQGDTMTGALVILNGGHSAVAAHANILLEIKGATSGALLHAESALTSSGVLIVRKNAGTSTGNILMVDTIGLVYDATNKRVGIGTASPTAALHLYGGSSADASMTFGAGAASADGLNLGYGGLSYGAGTSFINAHSAGGAKGVLRLLTDGNTVMTLSGSRVGIGTTSPSVPLHVLGQSSNEVARFQPSTDSSNKRSFITLYTTNPSFWWEFSNQDPSGSGSLNGLAFRERSNATSVPRLYLAAGGNVGVGTTSPGAKLEVVGDSGLNITRASNTDQYLNIIGGDGAGGATIRSSYGLIMNAASSSYPITFQIAGSEKMRVNSNGKVGIGTASPDTSLTVTQGTNANYVAAFKNTVQNGIGIWISAGNDTGASSNAVVQFTRPDGTGIGSITQNSATVIAYNTTSDQRLKENIVASTGGLALLNHIQVRDFTFKADPQKTKMQGFIAQELYAVYPEAVSKGTDEIDGSGHLLHPWGVDYGKLTPVLVKSIQELDSRLTKVESGSALSLRDLSSSGALRIVGQVSFGSGMTLATHATAPASSLLSVSSDVGGSGNTVFRITADGNTYSDGTFTGGGADYAEWFYASSSDLHPGEAVCIDIARQNTVARCSRSGHPNVIGIVSTKPAFIGNKFSGAENLKVPGTVLVGLIGQVPAKAIVEGSGGQIHAGDQLTTAGRPGYVRRAQAGEATVGVALQSLLSGEGRITVLISRRNQSLTVDMVEQKTLQAIRDMKVEDQVNSLVADAERTLSESGSAIQAALDAKLDALDLRGKILSVIKEMSGSFVTPSAQSAATPAGSSGTLAVRDALTVGGKTVLSGALKVGGTLNAEAIVANKTLMVAGDTSIGGDLYLGGALKVASLLVPGLLKVDGGLEVGHFSAGSGSVKALAVDRLRAGSGSRIDGTLTIAGRLELGSGGLLAFGSRSALELGNLTVRDALHVLGDVTVDGLARFLGDVHVEGQLVLSNRQAGLATLPKGGTGLTVAFGGVFGSRPVVTATPNDFLITPWRVTAMSATGFRIEVSSPAEGDLHFSWTALGVDPSLAAAVLPSSSSSSVPASSASSALLPFPVDENGVPLTGSDIEDACLRNQTPLDPSGHPYACGRYHVEHVWQFGMTTFEWNTLVDPPRLTPPAGYRVGTRTPPAVSGAMAGSGTTTATGSVAGSGGTVNTGSGSGTTGKGTAAGSGGTLTGSGSQTPRAGSGTTAGAGAEATTPAASGDASPALPSAPSASPDAGSLSTPPGEAAAAPGAGGDDTSVPPVEPAPSTPVPTP